LRPQKSLPLQFRDILGIPSDFQEEIVRLGTDQSAIGGTGLFLGSLSRRLQIGQSDRHNHSDDEQDDKHLNQCEPSLIAEHTPHPSRSSFP